MSQENDQKPFDPKIWLIGNRGMLGKQMDELFRNNGLAFYGTDMEVDIQDRSIVEEYIKDKNIEWIINCAAYTAVDRAEKEEEKAYQLNGQAVENVAKIAAGIKARLIHFSTDYVFDGDKSGAYKENDPTHPQTVYGKTKLAGEQQIQKNLDDFFIIRISWLYGIYGNNFVKTMVRLFKEKDQIGVVDDQIGSPTYTGQLAKNIFNLIQINSHGYGIYHYSDNGKISWYDFAKEIQDIAFKRKLIPRKITINPIPTENYPTPARRPQNSMMDKTKVTEILNFDMVDWDINLNTFFDEWAKHDHI